MSDNTNETKRFLVAVNHTAQSAHLLVWAARLAADSNASIQAVYVETLNSINNTQQNELRNNMLIARSLGIELRVVSNFSTVKGIVNFAFQEQITHIIIGKPKSTGILSFFRRGNLFNNLIKYSGDMHIYVLGADEKTDLPKFRERLQKPSFSSGLKEYLISALVIALSSAVLYYLKDNLGYRVVSYILLFEVSAMAFVYGTGPVLLASALSALIWNFFFIPPHFTLHIDNPEDVLMFVLFFTIALLNGVLTSQIRNQERKIRKREERTDALYKFTKELSGRQTFDEIKAVSVANLQKFFHCDVSLFIAGDIDNMTSGSVNESDAILFCMQNSVECGRFTEEFSGAEYSYFPLIGLQTKTGVAGLRLSEQLRFEERQFLESVLSQISAKTERELLRKVARKADLLDASDKLYKTLFNSISHELRIPVTTIMGASDTLVTETYPEGIRLQLLNEINIASIRLNTLIENLLNMSRLESGTLSPRLDWCDLHDLVNKLTKDLHQELLPFSFSAILPDEFPLVRIDFGLIEQVLYNLILNATQYAPVQSTISLRFSIAENALRMSVSDNGPGFTDGEKDAVFNKFYRGNSMRTGGTGLGLSIAKGFVQAHNGTISATNNAEGGALFDILLPIEISDVNSI